MVPRQGVTYPAPVTTYSATTGRKHSYTSPKESNFARYQRLLGIGVTTWVYPLASPSPPDEEDGGVRGILTRSHCIITLLSIPWKECGSGSLEVYIRECPHGAFLDNIEYHFGALVELETSPEG